MHAPLRRIQDSQPEKRSHTVSFRLTDTEWLSLRHEVKESGAVSAHEFARWLVVGHCTRDGRAVTTGGSDAK